MNSLYVYIKYINIVKEELKSYLYESSHNEQNIYTLNIFPLVNLPYQVCVYWCLSWRESAETILKSLMFLDYL